MTDTEIKNRIESLARLDDAAWESLCKCCGVCCMLKHSRHTGTYYTSVACNNLNLGTRRCAGNLFDVPLRIPQTELVPAWNPVESAGAHHLDFRAVSAAAADDRGGVCRAGGVSAGDCARTGRMVFHPRVCLLHAARKQRGGFRLYVCVLQAVLSLLAGAVLPDFRAQFRLDDAGACDRPHSGRAPEISLGQPAGCLSRSEYRGEWSVSDASTPLFFSFSRLPS